jgi:hypothetical protein
MITFFTTAKPFLGHSGTIQRNALHSWKLLHPEVEVILFGDEEGVAEVCAELDLRHEPHVERHESGFKYLNYMFERAQQIARHDYLCYSNCDIILCGDFFQAACLVVARREKCLMIGQRWDTDITEPLDFSDPEWAGNLHRCAKKTGTKQVPDFVDYFLFSRGLYENVPSLIVGRSFWDWWLVWKALSVDALVLDCTRFALAVHQNHGYGYHPGGKQGTNEDVLALRNIEVGGGVEHLRNTLDATYKLTKGGDIRYRPRLHRWLARRWDPIDKRLRNYARPLLYHIWLPVWHFALNLTRPLRARLGLRSGSAKDPSRAETLR